MVEVKGLDDELKAEVADQEEDMEEKVHKKLRTSPVKNTHEHWNSSEYSNLTLVMN